MQPAADTGQERGEETRRRLIAVGLRVFGREGFDGVSTRRIAAEAGANVAAIAYHFGGKRGLYLAVAASVAERNAAVVAPLEERVESVLSAGPVDRAALGALLADVVRGLVAGLMTVREDGRALFLLRELATPSDAFDILYDGFFLPLNRALAAIAAAALDLEADSPQAIMRGHLLLGAVMPLIAGRAVVERRLQRDILDPAHRAETTATAVAAACAALGLPSPTPQPEEA